MLDIIQTFYSALLPPTVVRGVDSFLSRFYRTPWRSYHVWRTPCVPFFTAFYFQFEAVRFRTACHFLFGPFFADYRHAIPQSCKYVRHKLTTPVHQVIHECIVNSGKASLPSDTTASDEWPACSNIAVLWGSIFTAIIFSYTISKELHAPPNLRLR